MSASREKKLRQDQTASGYVDPKAEKELEEKKAEKRSNVLYSVIAVLFVLVVAASFLWRSNVISRNATALTIDGEKYSAAEVNFYYQNVYRGFLQSNSYFISYLGLDTNASLKSQTVNATAASMMGVEEGSSWHDYIMDNTVKQMTMVQRGLKQAQEEGYQFPASVQEQYEDSEFPEDLCGIHRHVREGISPEKSGCHHDGEGLQPAGPADAAVSGIRPELF